MYKGCSLRGYSRTWGKICFRPSIPVEPSGGGIGRSISPDLEFSLLRGDSVWAGVTLFVFEGCGEIVDPKRNQY